MNTVPQFTLEKDESVQQHKQTRERLARITVQRLNRIKSDLINAAQASSNDDHKWLDNRLTHVVDLIDNLTTQFKQRSGL